MNDIQVTIPEFSGQVGLSTDELSPLSTDTPDFQLSSTPDDAEESSSLFSSSDLLAIEDIDGVEHVGTNLLVTPPIDNIQLPSGEMVHVTLTGLPESEVNGSPAALAELAELIESLNPATVNEGENEAADMPATAEKLDMDSAKNLRAQIDNVGFGGYLSEQMEAGGLIELNEFTSDPYQNGINGYTSGATTADLLLGDIDVPAGSKISIKHTNEGNDLTFILDNGDRLKVSGTEVEGYPGVEISNLSDGTDTVIHSESNHALDISSEGEFFLHNMSPFGESTKDYNPI